MIQDNCRTLIDVQEIDNNWWGMESSWPDQWASTLQADRRLFKQIERIIPCEIFLTKSSYPRKLRAWFSVSASSSKGSETKGSKLYCRYLDGAVVRTVVPKNVARMRIAGTTQFWVWFVGLVRANFLRGVSMITPDFPLTWEVIEEETFHWCFHQTKLYHHKFCPKIFNILSRNMAVLNDCFFLKLLLPYTMCSIAYWQQYAVAENISNIVFFPFSYLNIELCFYFRCST